MTEIATSADHAGETESSSTAEAMAQAVAAGSAKARRRETRRADGPATKATANPKPTGRSEASASPYFAEFINTNQAILGLWTSLGETTADFGNARLRAHLDRARKLAACSSPVGAFQAHQEFCEAAAQAYLEHATQSIQLANRLGELLMAPIQRAIEGAAADSEDQRA